ncbi:MULTISPECIES: terminase small subunit [Photobacterium]|uniref:terminase small subunit n=1 Tax=Photobacterium TaxID=657 RepID=UPI001C2DB92B|nr:MULTISPECIES: terminase small subunit [Photobacterium]MBV1842198.1 terminase small subunit [Photobacterium ganghwense]
MAEVNRNEFAEILGYSPKWIGDLIKDGLPHQGGGGRGKQVVIDTKEAIQWIIDREVQKQVGIYEKENASPKEGTKDGEDLLLTQARRRKADVEAKKAEEAVIDLGDLTQFLYSIANLFGSELDGAGARTAQEVAAENDPVKCKFIIDQENRRIRASTADGICAFVADYLAEHSRDGERETTEERSAVGV